MSLWPSSALCYVLSGTVCPTSVLLRAVNTVSTVWHNIDYSIATNDSGYRPFGIRYKVERRQYRFHHQPHHIHQRRPSTIHSQPLPMTVEESVDLEDHSLPYGVYMVGAIVLFCLILIPTLCTGRSRRDKEDWMCHQWFVCEASPSVPWSASHGPWFQQRK